MNFDAHCDIWTDITHHYLNHEHDIFREYHYERLKEGQIEGGIFVIWNDPPFDADPLKRPHQMMAAITQEEPECADILKISRSYEDMVKAREAGKMYAFIGLEGLKSIGEDIDMIDEFYKFGARHASLASVSYTHLDVYKRQGGGNSQRSGKRVSISTKVCHGKGEYLWTRNL